MESRMFFNLNFLNFFVIESKLSIVAERNRVDQCYKCVSGSAVESKEADRDSRSDSDSTGGGIESEETRLKAAARVRQIVQMSSGPLLAHT